MSLQMNCLNTSNNYTQFQEKIHTFSKTEKIIIEGLKCNEQPLMRFNELDSPFTEEEILKKGIKEMKNKKAAGTDRKKENVKKWPSLLDDLTERIVQSYARRRNLSGLLVHGTNYPYL